MQLLGIKKERPEGRSEMPEHNALVFVYDVLYLSYAHFKLFR